MYVRGLQTKHAPFPFISTFLETWMFAFILLVNLHFSLATLNFSRSVTFEHFVPKQLDRGWLCTSVTLAPKVVESCSKAEKTRQVL